MAPMTRCASNKTFPDSLASKRKIYNNVVHANKYCCVAFHSFILTMSNNNFILENYNKVMIQTIVNICSYAATAFSPPSYAPEVKASSPYISAIISS